MTRPRIAAVTIGQTPRPDLLEALAARARSRADIIETGALDGLARDRVPAGRAAASRDDGMAYPLTTRLRDGTLVTLDEADLAPLVQRAIDRAEAEGATVTLLLCAGGFLGVQARGTLVRPFDAAVRRLRALGARRVGVVVPYDGQAAAAARKFEAAGFDPVVAIGAPAAVPMTDAVRDVDAIVLDYVGHPTAVVEATRQRTALPVIDLGEAGAEAAWAAIQPASLVGAPPR